MSGLSKEEKILLLRTHMRAVIAHLTVPSATAASTNSNDNQIASATTVTPAVNVAPTTSSNSLFKPKVACTKKEGRCVGQYCVLPNGKFHGSHDNTGCSGVPVTMGPPKKRKRAALACSSCEN